MSIRELEKKKNEVTKKERDWSQQEYDTYKKKYENSISNYTVFNQKLKVSIFSLWKSNVVTTFLYIDPRPANEGKFGQLGLQAEPGLRQIDFANLLEGATGLGLLGKGAKGDPGPRGD